MNQNVDGDHANADSQSHSVTVAPDAGGHSKADAHPKGAPRVDTVGADQSICDTQRENVSPPPGAGGQTAIDTHNELAPRSSQNVQGDHFHRDAQSVFVSLNGAGHRAFDSHSSDARPKKTNGRAHGIFDTQLKNGASLGGEGDQQPNDTHGCVVSLPSLVQQVSELWRRRQAWHRAEKSLTLQIKAFCRRLTGGDKDEAGILYKALTKETDHALLEPARLSTLPLFVAREAIETERARLEKYLRKLSLQLPGAAYCEATLGLTSMTMGMLIGECPGINSRGFLDFDTPSRVWKRMGLAVMPDGQRQRAVSGAEAIEHGYNRTRRSVIWTIGDSLIKSKGPYRAVYDQCKAAELVRLAAKGVTVLPSAKITTKLKETGSYMSDGQVHKRAQRLTEKKLLVDLWVKFRDDAKA